MQSVAGNGDGKNGDVVIGEYESEYYEVERREDYADGVAHKKRLDASVVTYSLHDVAGVLGVEVAQLQLHELHKEIGDERYVGAGVYMEYYP